MITGDHKLTAVAVAKELGIHREGDLVFTGEDLSKIDDNEFDRVVDKITVYARVSPLDKLKIVKAWKNRGEVVAMTGDGVNDAPALKHADIGIAMGITGTEVAKEAADIVLSDDNFATIVRAIERGRWIYDNIKKYLTYLLRANITEVVVLGGVVMVMGPAYLPLLPAAILYINLATDGLPALALGVAPADPDIMQRPPRDPRESVFSKDIRTLILMAVIIECPIFLWMFFRSQPDMELARTQIFFMFVFIELIIAVNFRSLRYSLVQAPPHKWLLIAIAWELALIVVLIQFPAVRNAFGITMPSASDLGMIFALGVGIVIVIEVAKVAFRTIGARAHYDGLRGTGVDKPTFPYRLPDWRHRGARACFSNTNHEHESRNCHWRIPRFCAMAPIKQERFLRTMVQGGAMLDPVESLKEKIVLLCKVLQHQGVLGRLWPCHGPLG